MTPGTRMPDLQKLLTTKETAAVLAISTASLRDLVRAGEIAFISVGTGTERQHMSFHPRDIQDFVNRRRTRMAVSVGPQTARMATDAYPEGGFMARRAARLAAKAALDTNDLSAQRQECIAARKAAKATP